MTRIRTIKPTLFRHYKLAMLAKETSFPLQLVFCGLFICCDREGRFKWRPEELQLDILPYDKRELSPMLEALKNAGFIKQYVVNDETYGCIPTWHKHQRVNQREAPSELPPCPQDEFVNEENNTESIPTISPMHASPTEDKKISSQTLHVHACARTCGKGKELEGKGRGTGKGNGNTRAPAREESFVVSSPPAMVDKIFRHWKKVMQEPEAKLDAARRNCIQAALALGYDAEALQQAIDGCAVTPYNLGQNPAGERYVGLHVILRHADSIDRFRRNLFHPPTPAGASDKTSSLAAQNEAAGRAWLANAEQEEAIEGECQHVH